MEKGRGERENTEGLYSDQDRGRKTEETDKNKKKVRDGDAQTARDEVRRTEKKKKGDNHKGNISSSGQQR